MAVTGAFVIGKRPMAAMVMALYAIAELIEARAVDRARNSIKGLLDMAPPTALARSESGAWEERPVAEIAIGVLIRARPRERAAMADVARLPLAAASRDG